MQLNSFLVFYDQVFTYNQLSMLFSSRGSCRNCRYLKLRILFAPDTLDFGQSDSSIELNRNDKSFGGLEHCKIDRWRCQRLTSRSLDVLLGPQIN